MQIKEVGDLFKIYCFDEETKLDIIQLINGNREFLPKINAICLKAKISNKDSYLLHTNTYLLKQMPISIVYQTRENLPPLFIGIKISKNR